MLGSMPPIITLTAFVSRLPDPRYRRARRHPLLTILFIALCAVLAGADNLSEIARWAKAKQDWLQERVDLPGGIPSHDTIGRVLARLDPDAFAACFSAWTQALHQRTQGEVIALDGKTLRGSLDRASGIPALHLVSAWAAANRLVLAQHKVEGHENEIVAVPDLLALLCVQGCLVTGDALLCQKEVAAQVIDQGGDYVLALKQNHPILHESVQELFEYWRAQGWQTEGDKEPIAHQFARSVGKGHGRIEVRRCWVMPAHQVPGLPQPEQSWPGLRTVAALEYERRHPRTGETTRHTRYFLTSLEGPGVARSVLRAVRLHWGIENRLHWVLDVVFEEDKRRTRSTTGYAAQNLALLNKIALNLFRQDQTPNLGGIKAKRQVAGWDIRFLETLLTGKPYEIDNQPA
jgi:predicted transposase YbfD/YdcC